MSLWKRASQQSLPPAAVSQGFMSSNLHRRLAVSSSPAGLFLRPFDDSEGTYEGSSVKISWGSNPTPEAVADWKEESESVLVVDGVAGILQGPGKHTYIILIVDPTVAATLLDSRKSKILAVDGLVALPLFSHDLAHAAISKFSVKQAATRRRRAASVSTAGTAVGDETDDSTDSDSESDDHSTDAGTETEADSRPPSIKPSPKRPFWQKPFAPRTATKTPAPVAASSAEGASTLDKAPTPPSEPASMPLPELAAAATNASPVDAEGERAAQELDGKVLAELLRSLRGMYFSYDTDITRSLQHKYEQVNALSPTKDSGGGLVEPNPTLPLWRRADRRFFWNAHLMAPFIEAGLHSYIVVLQQGFVGHVSILLPLVYPTTLSATPPPAPSSIQLEFIIVTRRSVERPGLRYQRRGVNASGGVANFCETEFIVGASPDADRLHVSSFVQTRGSIPLEWGQSPWALKPAPFLARPMEESLPFMTKHFDTQLKHYGRQIIVNLAETSGKEAIVVDAYREGVKAMGNEAVKYVEFDFHNECKGMRYENISKLITSLTDDLEDLQSFWATDDRVFSTQSGAIRTNCIDCLDRTNVVQSALARAFLNRHLVHLGITSQQETGMHDGLDIAFNGLWADNGDAISREYAGTSALKGDFVRSGKRNWRGAMNDASNSVARLLQSTVTDFFRQAVIDYVLAVNLNVFSEFAERLETSDPGQILRLRKIREEAIETSTSQVLAEGETKVAAWTLLSPTEADVVRSPKNLYQERILLISNKAVYSIEYEYNLQKVVSFTRIPTGDIVSLQTGAYILSALEPSTRDAEENYGLLIRFRDHSATERIHTYTIKSFKLSSARSSSSATHIDSSSLPADDSKVRFLAFKALRRDAVRANDGQSRILERRETSSVDGGERVSGKTAKELVKSIVDVLREEGEKVGATEEGDDKWVVEKDIISLAESRAHTTLADRLGRSLQKAIWW